MPKYSGQWSIITDRKFVLVLSSESVCKSQTGMNNNNEEDNWGFNKFIEWREMMANAAKGEITIEIEVKITKMTGIAKPKPRSFDENQREFADVVLTVEGEDFYVLKKFMASKSSYFKSMFLSNFEEAIKDQIDLPNIDARDFQSFLDVIHGEVELDDSSIEGVLHLTHMYDAPSVLKACEKFLILESTMTDVKKFELSKKYSMEKLAEKCISGMKVDEIDAALQDKEISSAISTKLAKQMVVLYKKDVKEPGST